MTYLRPHVRVLVGMVLMGVALVLEIVGLAAPGWGSLWVGKQGDTMVGLWEFCYELPNFTCEDIERLWNETGWLEVCRALGVIAVLVQGACLLCVLLLCCFRQYPIFFAVTAWAALCADVIQITPETYDKDMERLEAAGWRIGLLIFVEFSVFVGVAERTQNTLGRDFEYQYAFVLTVLAFVFSLLASLFFFIEEARHRKCEPSW